MIIVATSNMITLDCGKLRIELQRVNDRWGHAIGFGAREGFQRCARSIEGNAEDFWPASPALQELHVEDRADGQVAFLTGMAGSNHWSVSIACHRAHNRATLDVACRCKQPPEWLGSLYQIPEEGSVRYQESRAELRLPDSSHGLIASTTNLLGSVPQFPPDRENSWTRTFVESVKSLRPTLFIAPEAFEAGTIRWVYAFALSKSE